MKSIITSICLLLTLGVMPASCRNKNQAKENIGMEFDKALKIRKSVRAFLDKDVEEAKLRYVVEAGNMAAGTPTVGRRYFTVISNKKLIREIADGAKEAMRNSGIPRAMEVGSNPAYNPSFDAPAVILVSVDKQDNPTMAVTAAQNAATAGENMLLAATSVGLGSCYVGSLAIALQNAKIREACGIGENTTTICAILLGYSKDNTPHAERPENPDNINYIK